MTATTSLDPSGTTPFVAAVGRHPRPCFPVGAAALVDLLAASKAHTRA